MLPIGFSRPTALLRGAIGIHTHLTLRERFNLYRLARLASRAQPEATIVEIGSYLGASTVFLAGGLLRGRGRVLCIDTWENDGMSEGERDTFEAFLANTTAFGDQVLPIRGRSEDPATLARVRSECDGIDLLFVDGDHSFEGVARDWENFGPMLRPGAWAAFHDVGWAEGVRAVVEDRVKLVTTMSRGLPNLWIGRVRATTDPSSTR